MGTISKSSTFIPEVWQDAVSGAVKGGQIFVNSPLAKAGIVRVDGSLKSRGPKAIGEVVTVPYFDMIGDLESNVEGTALTPKDLGMTKESNTVAHDGIAIEVTSWPQWAQAGDPYDEGVAQMAKRLNRRMDLACINAAIKSTSDVILKIDKYSLTIPRYLDWDLTVDGRLKWGDENAEVAGLMVHSRVFGDLLKTKDATGRSLLVLPQTEGDIARFCGVPVFQSDRLIEARNLAMGAVTAVGTSPPTITLTGTANRLIDLRIECTTLGALATSKIRYSIDGGSSWKTGVTTAATLPLLDPMTGEDTGVTINIAAGAAAVDNVWTAQTVEKYTSLLLRPGALSFWYNQDAMSVQTDRNILKDSDLAAMHLYYVAHKYKRMNGSAYPGVVELTHNGGRP